MSKSKTIHMIESTSDEQYELFQSIIQNAEKRITMLESMTREERIEYFRSRLYPQDINFDLDCGGTVLHVNSKFAKTLRKALPARCREYHKKLTLKTFTLAL